MSLAQDQAKDHLWRTAKVKKVALSMRAASKQINEVKNMTGQSAGEDYLHFNTKEIGLVERAEKE